MAIHDESGGKEEEAQTEGYPLQLGLGQVVLKS
jgi:hypothetical protein